VTHPSGVRTRPPLQRRRPHRPRARRAPAAGPGRNTPGPSGRAGPDTRE